MFPLLAATGQGELAARLLAEHAEMAAAWAMARVPLEDVARELWRAEDAERVRSVWLAFATLYRGHVETEDRLAYPAASALIDSRRLALMRDDMAARRGVQRTPGLDDGQSGPSATAENGPHAVRRSEVPRRP